jgi:hypothetical protein
MANLNKNENTKNFYLCNLSINFIHKINLLVWFKTTKQREQKKEKV